MDVNKPIHFVPCGIDPKCELGKNYIVSESIHFEMNFERYQQKLVKMAKCSIRVLGSIVLPS